MVVLAFLSTLIVFKVEGVCYNIVFVFTLFMREIFIHARKSEEIHLPVHQHIIYNLLCLD